MRASKETFGASPRASQGMVVRVFVGEPSQEHCVGLLHQVDHGVQNDEDEGSCDAWQYQRTSPLDRARSVATRTGRRSGPDCNADLGRSVPSGPTPFPCSKTQTNGPPKKQLTLQKKKVGARGMTLPTGIGSRSMTRLGTTPRQCPRKAAPKSTGGKLPVRWLDLGRGMRPQRPPCYRQESEIGPTNTSSSTQVRPTPCCQQELDEACFPQVSVCRTFGRAFRVGACSTRAALYHYDAGECHPGHDEEVEGLYRPNGVWILEEPLGLAAATGGRARKLRPIRKGTRTGGTLQQRPPPPRASSVRPPVEDRRQCCRRQRRRSRSRRNGWIASSLVSSDDG